MANIPVFLRNLLSRTRIFGFTVLVAVIILLYQAEQKQAATAEQSSLNLKLIAQLQQTKQHNPAIFIIHDSAWQAYVATHKSLLLLFQQWKYQHESLLTTRTHQEFADLIKKQSQMLQWQNELMQLRSQKEKISFRIDRLLESADLILQSLESATGQPEHSLLLNKLIYKLKFRLQQLQLSNQQFWMIDPGNNMLLEKLNFYFDNSLKATQILLNAGTGLKSSAQRREALTINKDLNLLKEQLQSFHQTLALIRNVKATQQKVQEISQSLIDGLSADSTAAPDSLLYYLGVLIVISIAIVILSATRRESDGIRLDKIRTPTKADYNLNEGLKVNPQTDLTLLINHMQLAAKGDLSQRIDERLVQPKELVVAYNQMISAFYKQTAKIVRDVQRLNQILMQRAQVSEEHANASEDISNPTTDWIAHTYEIAAIAEQLKQNNRKTSQYPEDYHADTNTLIAKLDNLQALLRVKIRDTQSRYSADFSALGVACSDLETLKKCADSLQRSLNFYQLNRRY